MNSIIQANNIFKKYDRVILDYISLEIKQGDFITIFGKSGEGKSTLLYILGGLLKPDEGDVLFFSKNIYTDPTLYRKRNIGFVFQFFHLISTLNVYENLTLPAKISNVAIDDSTIKRVAKSFDIKNILYSFPQTLSGGEKQRVALARAILKNPKLILCDEPTGNLDDENSNFVFDTLKELNSKGVTVVLVTHNPTLIYGKVYELKSGNLAVI
jgi:putative ABC transport system ATP-binding protein